MSVMPLWWMIGASVVSWVIVAAIAGSRAHPEALLGMIGPLASASVTWILVARAHASAAERVIVVLVAGLAVKMVFFGVYVAVMLRPLAMRPVPFVASFTSYFIALYAMEAMFLKRLFVQGARPPSGAPRGLSL